MAAKRKKVAAHKAPAKKTSSKKTVAKKTAAKKPSAKATTSKVVERRVQAPKAKKTTFQKLLTAEGWKRLMMGAKK